MAAACLLVSCTLTALSLVGASWIAAPLSHFASEEGEQQGIRRFWHHEHCQLQNGGHLSLRWSLRANPFSILSLDSEYPYGVRMRRCKTDRIVLRLPAGYVQQLRAYRYVVSSRHLHACEHLLGEHSYHEVVQVLSVAYDQSHAKEAEVSLATRNLASASEIASDVEFSFSYLPPEAVTGTVVTPVASQHGKCSATKHRVRAPPRRASATQQEERAENSMHKAGVQIDEDKQKDISATAATTASTSTTTTTTSTTTTTTTTISTPTTTPTTITMTTTTHQVATSQSNDKPHVMITREKLAKHQVGSKAASGRHRKPVFRISKIGRTTSSKTTISSTTVNTLPEHLQVENQNVLNFVPRKVANFGWNWDFKTSMPKETVFKMNFPDGNALLQLTHPYVRVHAGLTINFTSKMSARGEAPLIRLRAALKGWAFIAGDIEAVFNTTIDQMHSTNLLSHSETTHMEPLEFFLGNIPVSIASGARLGFNASYLGQLRGTMRMGIQGRTAFEAVMYYSSEHGVLTDFKAEPLEGQFWPPSWLMNTRRFRLSALLENSFWVDASIGRIRNAHLSMGLLPHLNLSLTEESAEPSESSFGASGKQKSLVVYPFRVIGLNPDEEFAVKVRANGRENMTTTQIGFGVIEYSDHIQKFDFGPIGEADLMMNSIDVVLLRRGIEPVATASTSCSATVDGECTPSPVDLQMTVDGVVVIVQLKILWQDNPVTELEKKIRSVSLGFQYMKATPRMSAILKAAGRENQPIAFQLTRNGRQFAVPAKVNATDPHAVVLTSNNITYELGSSLIENWATRIGSDTNEGGITVPERLQKLVQPTFALVIGGKVIGESQLPDIVWDKMGGVSRGRFGTEIYDGQLRAPALGVIPVSFALQDSVHPDKDIGIVRLTADITDMTSASFWIYPDEAEQLPQGRQHRLIWKVNAPDTEEVTFAIRAYRVNYTGAFQDTDFVKIVTRPCYYEHVTVKRYHKFRNACTFSTTVGPSDALRGRIIFMIGWFRDYRDHVMMSAPIDFVSGNGNAARKLKEGAGPLLVETTKVNFQQALQDMNPHCSGLPVTFNITIGMLLRNQIRVHNLNRDRSVLGPTSNYDTGWAPLKIDLNAMDKFAFALMFPTAICQNGGCQGKLPACSRSALPRIAIPHLRFFFSRPFNWTAKSMQGVRHVLAYGLGVLPEVLDIVGTSDESTQGMNRRLVSGSDSNWFLVRLAQPLTYNVNSHILDSLVHNGVWRGLSDGQESTHGPVRISRVVTVHESTSETSISSRGRSHDALWQPWGFVAVACACVGLIIVSSALLFRVKQAVRPFRWLVIDVAEYAAAPGTIE